MSGQDGAWPSTACSAFDFPARFIQNTCRKPRPVNPEENALSGTPLYFDCLAEVGPREGKDPLAPWTTEHLLADMDHCGIAGALVSLTLHTALDAQEGRRRLAHETAKAPGRLFPLWPVCPGDAGDFESADEFVAEARKACVRAVGLYPAAYRFPLDGDVLAPLLGAAQEAGLLLVLPADQTGADATSRYRAYAGVCGAFPRLAVLGTGFGWGDQRTVCALLERFPNFRIEWSRYQVHRGPETLVGRFGPERFLFGTGAPSMHPGAARAFVDYAEIPPEAKRLVAGGNLAKLLGAEPSPTPIAWGDDPIRLAAARGEPLSDFAVLDAHSHVLDEGGQGAGHVVMRDGGADGILRNAELLGTRSTAMMSWSGPLGGDMHEGNETVFRAMQRHPGKITGAAYVNPAHYSAEEIRAELRLRVDAQGFLGVKPYPRVGLAYDDTLWAPAWEFADERGLYCLMHVAASTGGTAAVGRLAERYPRAAFLVAHSGSTWALAREVAGLMKERPNVWAELTYTSVTNGAVEYLADEGDARRVLYGSDAPMRDARPQFGWVAWSRLPAETRRGILGGNFARLVESVRAGKEAFEKGK